MKNFLFLLVFVSVFFPLYSQQNKAYLVHDITFRADFNNLEEALKHPEQVYFLDLSHQNIDSLPESIGRFTNLNTLYLQGNNISVLPDSIANLKKLKTVNLSNNYSMEFNKAVEVLAKCPSIESFTLSHCDMNYLPLAIGEMKNLKKLDIHGNKLTNLPFSMQNLKSLEVLDLSVNQLIELNVDFIAWTGLQSLNLSFNPNLDFEQVFPVLSMLPNLKSLKINGLNYLSDKISMLKQVKELDISESNLKNLSSSIRFMESLEKLTIHNCTAVNYSSLFTKISALKNLKEIDFRDDELSIFPSGLSVLKNISSITIRGKKLAELPADFSHIQNLSSVYFEFCPVLDLEKVIGVCGKINSLKKFSVRYSGQNMLPPNLIELTGVNEIDLFGNNVTYIPPTIKFLTQLKVLDLRQNPMESSRIQEIQFEMPDLKIFSDDKKPDGTKTAEKTNFSNLTLTVSIDPAIPNTLTFDSFVKFDIPQNAFLDKNGSPVTGKVDFSCITFKDAIDLIFSPVPMSIDSGNQKIPFSSEGMFFVKATSGGEPVFTNPNAPITATTKSRTDNKGYSIWFYDTIQNKWIFKQKDSTRAISQTSTSTISSNRRFSSMLPPRYPMEVNYENVYFYFPKKSDFKNFEFSVYGQYSAFYYQKIRKSSFARKQYPELFYLRRIILIYDGDSAKRDYRMLRSVSRKTTPQCIVKDIRLYPNPNQDNYILQFLFRNDTIYLPVSLKTNTFNPEAIQSRNKAFFDKYNRLLNQRIKNWAEIDRKQIEAIKKYEAEMQLFRRANLLDRKALDTVGVNKYTFERSFLLDGFGYWNCDVLYRLNNPVQLYARFMNENNEIIPAERIQVIDFTYNGLLSFEPDQKVVYSNNNRIAIVATLSNNTLGVCFPDEVSEIPNTGSLHKVLNVHTYFFENMTIGKIRAIFDEQNNK